MKTLNLKGIVIGNLDYKDSSKIVYLYTKYGRISVRAIGCKRKKSNMLSFITTLNEVDFIVNDTSFPTLIDYSLISSNNHIKNDLKSNLWFMYLLQILNKLPNDNFSEKTFLFLLRIINHAKNIDPIKLVCLFQVKMLYLFGVKPHFDRCIISGETNDLVFDIINGGSVSLKYASNITFSNKCLKEIEILYKFNDQLDNFNSINDFDYKLIAESLNKYYNIHISPLKGFKYLIYN